MPDYHIPSLTVVLKQAWTRNSCPALYSCRIPIALSKLPGITIPETTFFFRKAKSISCISLVTKSDRRFEIVGEKQHGSFEPYGYCNKSKNEQNNRCSGRSPRNARLFV
ncbi:MAG: hypothetical protein M0Q91_02830 [Methanoregula sp.]|nr:hypothetical protein [Methanoregula sp.]